MSRGGPRRARVLGIDSFWAGVVLGSGAMHSPGTSLFHLIDDRPAARAVGKLAACSELAER
jgi:hypothetical protein